MKIQFINAPYLGRFSRAQRSPGVIKSGTMYYPYWLAHAAAVAEQQGHAIHLVDCPAKSLSEMELHALVRDFQPDMLVLESVAVSWRSDCRVAAHLKSLLPKSTIVLVGTHVTAMREETLLCEPAIDFVVIGEYDYAVSDIARALENDIDFLEIPGIACRRNEKIVKTRERPLIENLDDLPWISPIVKRFLNPYDYYFNLSFHPMLMLISGRGCNGFCFYCAYPQVVHGHRHRHRSPESVVAEMLWVQNNMPEIREITFEDDNFAADPQFARRFAENVRESGVKLPFFANVRTTVDYNTLKALKDAGLRNTAVGFESGDNIILSNMRKGQNLNTQKKFMHNARKLGLLVHGCFMVGFPGETAETMNKTLELAKELRPDSAQFYPVMPYPGTGAYAYYKREGYLIEEEFDKWLTDEGRHRCVLNLPNLPPETIEAFCEAASRKYHFRPRYLFYKLNQLMVSPREGWRSLKAGLRFLQYTLKNRRKKTVSSHVPHLSPPVFWREHIKVPMGRMERLTKGLDPSIKAQIESSDAL